MKKTLLTVSLLVCASLASANSTEFTGVYKGMIQGCTISVYNQSSDQSSKKAIEDLCKSCISNNPIRKTEEYIIEATKQCTENVLTKGEK